VQEQILSPKFSYRDNIQEVLLEEMKDYADETDSEKLK
jgi:hypothetical protein